MRCRGAALCPVCDFPGQFDRLARHLVFRPVALLGYFLDGMAVLIAGGKIHRAIDVARVAAQGLLDHAHRLDKDAPVHGPEKPQTADGIAHGDPVRGLLVVLRPYQVFDGQMGLGQSLFDPGER